MAGGSSRYQRVGIIASGGMATVYLGRALGAGGFERPVAIKVMHPHIAQNPEFVSMFLDEGRLAARIRHANVVPTVDVEADESGVFLVMEYVDGMSLHRLAKTFRAAKVQMPPAIALRIMVDSLSGLHAAHELRSQDGAPLMLVHRDVSPQNILVGTDGVARLTDFGVARAESRLSAATKTGQVKGKIAYMSAEQLRSKPVDRRSDIYSAAIVAWELLAGERLFTGDSEGAIALSAAEGATRKPSEVNPASPPVLDEVVMKALGKDPNGRYPTAAAFGEALEDAALGGGLRIAKPRAVAQLLKEDPDMSDEQLPPGCLGVAKRLRTDVITSFAKAHTALPGHVPGEEASSKPTDKFTLPSTDTSSPGSEKPLSSPKTSVATVITRDSITIPKRRNWTGVVVLGASLVGAAAGVVYWLRLPKDSSSTNAASTGTTASEASSTTRVSEALSSAPDRIADGAAPPTKDTAESTVASSPSSATVSTPASASASGSAATKPGPAKTGPTPAPKASTFRPKVL